MPYEHAVSNLVWLCSSAVSETNFHCINRKIEQLLKSKCNLQSFYRLISVIGYPTKKNVISQYTI